MIWRNPRFAEGFSFVYMELIMITDIQSQLFTLADEKYKAFNAKLIPSVPPAKMIGIRTPVLRKYADEQFDASYFSEFLDTLPHEYYEENNLHGILIGLIKDYNEAVRRLDEFLPYVDNWSTCDTITFAVLKKHTDEFYLKIKEWLKSEHGYTKRFAITRLMAFYLDDKFDVEHLEVVSDINSSEYYVNMAIAWYFATALAKQYNATIPYFINPKLGKWTHNKAIQKAIESYRVTPEHKEFLKTLRIK